MKGGLLYILLVGVLGACSNDVRIPDGKTY